MPALFILSLQVVIAATIMSKMPQAQMVLDERAEVHPTIAAIIVVPTFNVAQCLVERVVFHSPVEAAIARLAADPGHLLLTSPVRVTSIADLPMRKELRISSGAWVVVGAQC